VAATREDNVATSKRRSTAGRITPGELASSRPHADFLREHLADDANVAALLDEALAGGDEGDVMYALRAISDARGGIASVATVTGLSRETLYRTLSRTGNPRLSTLLALMRASGVRLRAEPAG
jgi:probable addiction module antidote protein